VDGDAGAALGVVSAAFDRSGRPAFAHIAQRPIEDDAGGALVVRCPGRRVLVLRDQPLARQLREQLSFESPLRRQARRPTFSRSAGYYLQLCSSCPR
jgi:hypothetical protein